MLADLAYTFLSTDCTPIEGPETPLWLNILANVSLVITTLFLAEIPFTLWALGAQYYNPRGPVVHAILHLFDALVILTTFILEIVLRGRERELASLLVILRLWRLVKLGQGRSRYYVVEDRLRGRLTIFVRDCRQRRRTRRATGRAARRDPRTTPRRAQVSSRCPAGEPGTPGAPCIHAGYRGRARRAMIAPVYPSPSRSLLSFAFTPPPRVRWLGYNHVLFTMSTHPRCTTNAKRATKQYTHVHPLEFWALEARRGGKCRSSENISTHAEPSEVWSPSCSWLSVAFSHRHPAHQCTAYDVLDTIRCYVQMSTIQRSRNRYKIVGNTNRYSVCSILQPAKSSPKTNTVQEIGWRCECKARGRRARHSVSTERHSVRPRALHAARQKGCKNATVGAQRDADVDDAGLCARIHVDGCERVIGASGSTTSSGNMSYDSGRPSDGAPTDTTASRSKSM